uniref:Uncharacterized protein n=1 Tax=Oryza brachyantha TaxID=4533 RepID=J3LDJ2_ORYBR
MMEAAHRWRSGYHELGRVNHWAARSHRPRTREYRRRGGGAMLAVPPPGMGRFEDTRSLPKPAWGAWGDGGGGARRTPLTEGRGRRKKVGGRGPQVHSPNPSDKWAADTSHWREGDESCECVWVQLLGQMVDDFQLKIWVEGKNKKTGVEEEECRRILEEDDGEWVLIFFMSLFISYCVIVPPVMLKLLASLETFRNQDLSHVAECFVFRLLISFLVGGGMAPLILPAETCFKGAAAWRAGAGGGVWCEAGLGAGYEEASATAGSGDTRGPRRREESRE